MHMLKQRGSERLLVLGGNKPSIIPQSNAIARNINISYWHDAKLSKSINLTCLKELRCDLIIGDS